MSKRLGGIVVSHIQRIGCQLEQMTLHGGQSRSLSAEQKRERRTKEESFAAHPPPPTPDAARSFGEINT